LISHAFLSNKGLTVIELMIVMAIVRIIAAVALPNYIAYRDEARVIAVVASGVREALAAATADNANNLYPADTKVTKASGLKQYG
jgi:type IV pilus assembly protein PilA